MITANLRQNYEKNILMESDLQKCPFEQFSLWFKDTLSIKNILEPNAMSLSTISKYGRPSSRMVLLKDFNKEGFVFFTNYKSRKAQDLDYNNQAALLFFWPDLERQVRIEGTTEKIEEKLSDKYFNSRPFESKIGAWSSPQSQPISRQDLEDRKKEYTFYYEKEELVRPDYWGGYRLIPDSFEFWQGRTCRLHDRLQYSLKNLTWKIQRLAP